MLGLLLFAIYFATVSTMRYTTKMKNSNTEPNVPEVFTEEEWTELEETWKELAERYSDEPETDEKVEEVQTPSETSNYAIELANILSDEGLVGYANTLGIKANRRWKRETILERIRSL